MKITEYIIMSIVSLFESNVNWICPHCGCMYDKDLFDENKDPKICPACGNERWDISHNPEIQKEIKYCWKKYINELDWLEHKIGHPIPPELMAKYDAYNKRVNEYIRSGQYRQDQKDKMMEEKFNETSYHPLAVQVECPYCHATDTKKISGVSRMVSVGTLGPASKKIGKQWHCNHCGSDF